MVGAGGCGDVRAFAQSWRLRAVANSVHGCGRPSIARMTAKQNQSVVKTGVRAMSNNAAPPPTPTGRLCKACAATSSPPLQMGNPYRTPLSSDAQRRIPQDTASGKGYQPSATEASRQAMARFQHPNTRMPRYPARGVSHGMPSMPMEKRDATHPAAMRAAAVGNRVMGPRFPHVGAAAHSADLAKHGTQLPNPPNNVATPHAPSLNGVSKLPVAVKKHPIQDGASALSTPKLKTPAGADGLGPSSKPNQFYIYKMLVYSEATHGVVVVSVRPYQIRALVEQQAPISHFFSRLLYPWPFVRPLNKMTLSGYQVVSGTPKMLLLRKTADMCDSPASPASPPTFPRTSPPPPTTATTPFTPPRPTSSSPPPPAPSNRPRRLARKLLLGTIGITALVYAVGAFLQFLSLGG
ncbi:hypothetical protein CDD81_8101 [Ophiocordyceps australis]|uniref:Uncharacterized protein n=1 Tax=Ophiocordyceps australis TaxID=1399860 RepID=A0A2C5XYW0_9HYPO|nr:hypothetical protein CDD81_8101 [Ophiocordyceps australis]